MYFISKSGAPIVAPLLLSTELSRCWMSAFEQVSVSRCDNWMTAFAAKRTFTFSVGQQFINVPIVIWVFRVRWFYSCRSGNPKPCWWHSWSRSASFKSETTISETSSLKVVQDYQPSFSLALDGSPSRVWNQLTSGIRKILINSWLNQWVKLIFRCISLAKAI